MKPVLAAIVLVSFLGGCSNGKDPWQQRPGPKVVAFFPPLYSLAATVAGDDAQVASLITYQGPHDYEPSPQDARMLHGADLFLTIGLGLDDVVSRKLAKSSSNKKLKRVALGERLPKQWLHEGGCSCGHKHGPGENHDRHNHQVQYDPHVWLSPTIASAIAVGIAEELSALDPAHKAGYQSRAAALSDRLAALQKDGNQWLAEKKEKPKVISFHGSLHYFAPCFGVEVVDSIEAPGQEPSPKKISQLVEACQKHGARLIAVEPQYPSHTGAKVLFNELKRKGIDAEFVEIDPLETAMPADLSSDFYERKLRDNLRRLAAVLK